MLALAGGTSDNGAALRMILVVTGRVSSATGAGLGLPSPAAATNPTSSCLAKRSPDQDDQVLISKLTDVLHKVRKMHLPLLARYRALSPGGGLIEKLNCVVASAVMNSIWARQRF